MSDNIYHMALQNVVRHERRDMCVILINGADALDFVQRISTNDVRSIDDNVYATTIFCNDKGRIVDVVIVLRRGDDLYLVHTASQRDELVRHLRTYIVMDDVRLRDVSQNFRMIELTGPLAAQVCSSAFHQNILPFPPTRVYSLDADSSVLALPLPSGAEQSFLIMIDRERLHLQSQQCIEHLESCEELDNHTAEVLRIEQGRGAMGTELGREHNPLEANLLHLVNFKKGLM